MQHVNQSAKRRPKANANQAAEEWIAERGGIIAEAVNTGIVTCYISKSHKKAMINEGKRISNKKP